MSFLKTFQVIRDERNHMATTFSFRVCCDTRGAGLAARVLEECHLEVARLERELSEYLEESPVFRLNRAEPGAPVEFTGDGIALLARSFGLRDRSGGCFDPLAKSRGAGAGLDWDAASREVRRRTSGTWLGFGAIGKGYALDRARERIDSAGFESYVLSAGGSSVVLSGFEGSRSPWKWGWSWKKDELGNDLGVVLSHSSGCRIALGVSGTHEKGNHIVGATSSIRSALVATASAADADALSTALFVSGGESGRAFLDGFQPVPPAVAWIEEGEVPRWNGRFQSLFAGLGMLLLALWFTAPAAYCDESVDLGAAADAFTPYVFDRNSLWILLPLFSLALLLLHLRKTKPKRTRQRMLNL